MASTTSKTPPAKPLPDDALKALQKLCKESSQADVSRLLDVSQSTITNALRGRYIGNVDRLAERIRGELLNETVGCPVLGEITLRICQDQREKKFSAHNSQAVRLWRACQSCPHNPKAKS